jgi:hypothetical protein
MVQPLPIRWIARSVPLSPSAVVAVGATARALGQRLLAMDDEHRARLTGSSADDLLVVCGKASDLPWADGVVYLGIDDDAPNVLLPTTRRPDVPLDLFARAITARCESEPSPIAVLETPACLIPLGAQRHIDAGVLREWLERAS